MPDIQNAVLFPSLASQKVYQMKCYTPINKENDSVSPSQNTNGAVEKDAQDSVLSFLALLSRIVSQPEKNIEPHQVLDLRFSASYGQAGEEYTASLPIAGGDKSTFSKSIWDIMVSMKNDLEKKGVDMDALSEEVNGVFAGLGAGKLSDLDLKTAEAVLSRLRDKYDTTMGSAGPRNIDIKVSVSGYLKLGLEASLKDNVAQDVPTGAVIQGAPDAPVVQVDPVAPDTPIVSAVPRAPDAPAVQVVQVDPAALNTPIASAALRAPDAPAIPVVQVDPAALNTPIASAALRAPDAPAISAVQVAPIAPTGPEVPGAPVVFAAVRVPEKAPGDAVIKAGIESAEELEVEEEHPESIQRANGYVLPAADGWLNENKENNESNKKAAADQPQLWAFSRLHSYLKPDVQVQRESGTRKGYDAQKADPVYKQTQLQGRNVSDNVKAGALSAQAKPKDESESGLRDWEEKAAGDQRKDGDSVPAKDAVVRSAPKEAARLLGNENEPKTNFTEHKAIFEQFFEQVLARRGSPGSGAATTPGLELAKGSPFSQGEALRDGLYNVIRFIRNSGEQRAVLTVDPPALGRISVELVSSSTGLEASIKVSSEQVRQVIQDHLAQLKLSLEQQGVHLTYFSVDVQQDNERRNQWQGNTRRRRAALAEEDDAVDEEAFPGFRVDLNEGLLYWVA